MNIYEIAKLSGVAPSTVSKVINNYSGVSEKTRAKVMKVIEENSFVSNMNARNLKKKSNLVGIILPSDDRIDMNSPFHARIMNAFRRYCANRGYDTVFVSRYLLEKKVSYLEHCQYMNIAGVLVVAYDRDDQNVIDVISSDIPVVSTHYRNNDNICEIISDDRNGTRMAVEHLISLGHTDIGYICGPEANSSSALARLGGFVDIMREHGLNIEEGWVRYAKRYQFEEGYEVMHQWLKEGKAMPTAIAVASDTLSFGAVKAMKENGIRIPEDISVIGFDDHEASRYVTPELTTIRQDLTLIGQTAGAKLIEIMDREHHSERVIVPVTLVERHSCRNLTD